MIVKQRSSSLHALKSPLLLLLLLLLLVVVTCTAGNSSMTAHALSTSVATRRRPPVDRSLSRMSMTATSATTMSGDASSDTNSPTCTEPTDDYLPTSPASSPDLNFLQPTPADTTLQNWCQHTAGIALSSSIQICTTTKSVAGRGLFATQDVEEGEVLALIPREVVVGAQNCREQLGVDEEVKDAVSMNSKNKGGRKRRWMKNIMSKLTSFRRRRGGTTCTGGSRQSPTSEITDESTVWGPILTIYALEAKASKHPWSEWIDQWNRCDPMHDAYLKMGPILRIATDDLPEHQMMVEELICDTAAKIRDIMPHLDEKHLQAAVSIRLSRLEQHFRALGFVEDDGIDLDEAVRLYSLITSRAIELDSDTTAVLPFYDLANHSLDPNLGLEYVENDGNANGVESAGFYSIFARRDIAAGSELFFRYTKFEEAMNDTAALWAAINWGIPHFEDQYET